jgi:hypothetical protein
MEVEFFVFVILEMPHELLFLLEKGVALIEF